jgi:hypothetical protein
MFVTYWKLALVWCIGLARNSQVPIFVLVNSKNSKNNLITGELEKVL